METTKARFSGPLVDLCANVDQATTEFIRKSATQLRALTRATEQDFLSVGEYLQKLSLQSAKAAKAAGSILELVTGEDVEKDMERLREVTGLMNGYLGECQAQFHRDSVSLTSMLKAVEEAYRPLSVFRKIVKHLHMLGVSTRIENARLSNDGNFQVLAERVEKLSLVIASKSDGILTGLISLDEAVKQTLSKVLSGNQTISDRTREILDTIASSLSTLSRKRTLSSQAAARLAGQSEDVSTEMSGLISSLQFHDITRQQIEHVIEAFEELSAPDRPDTGAGSDRIHILEDVGRLQMDQLDHARNGMVMTIARIADGLHAVARHLSEMVKETESLMGDADTEDSSFLSKLKDSVSFVIGSLRENAETDRELAEAVKYLSGLIEHLSAFLNDIEEIAYEIELIALNAQIRAARTAGSGGALGVLAEAMRNLSDATRAQTLDLTATLETAKRAAMKLGRAEDRKGNDGELAAITADMESLFQSLGLSQETLSSLLRELKSETGELTHAVEAAAAGMSAHTRTDDVISSVIEGMRKHLPDRRTAGSEETGREAACLDKLASRYTMHQERYLHEVHLGRILGTGPERQKQAANDNVELF